MEAKTTKHHSIQAAEVTCSKAISDAKAQTTSQAVMFQKEHCNYLQDLEEQALGEESRSHQDVLSSCQAALHHSPQSIRGALAASYHLLLRQAPQLPSLAASYHLLLRQAPQLPSLIQSPRTPPMEEQTSSATPPILMPKQSSRLKR